ncbi:phosphate ABC transporter substrate-binding protein PstS family protein [Heyndrickxia coagulans]|uniref:Phosphate-binding protein n=1 Tax=Heyndrickxia coagulans DSM 1 = ATCC 7050 TaxID=1121088 RepID=A0A8B4BY38_HEYCO|nr:phosphate ABC transporter substrate-binding protein PstS family protein [Heyndrickxia coagulans]AJH77075.1 phosphate binding family protein [Heyndrickxia coagulans DSM 1 = ATCC 7050]MBF8419147.1 phosphate ABC transporter substrate-binding protein PstS family protein [Heyndrickxia coagulans]MCR2847207.1 phosphate ABC transporter substrate-binding protein PstS family protein [Heyndrickxia coagulans]MDR4224797.1 phosphate ABC transporter substrate-binding protein PstS family protein [Heyndrickx
MKKKFAALFGLLTIFAVIAAGCGNAKGTATSGNGTKQESITAVGSTALQPLVQEAAAQYMNDHPGATINVQGGGSGTGLSKVAEGAVQIGNSDVFAEEKDGIDASKITDHKVAVVGFAPVANQDIGVDNLTKQQLIGIFTGKIKNWKEVGGKDLKIVVINRAEGSGTRAVFEKQALDGATAVKAQEQDSSGTVQKIVNETPGAISYLAFSYINNKVKALKVDGVEPAEENVKTNKWKIWAYEHMYTKGKAKGLTEKFIDYMLSDEVQKNLVPKLGYMPISEMQVERDAGGNVTTK